GQVGGTERPERRCEKIRQPDGDRSFQGEQRVDGAGEGGRGLSSSREIAGQMEIGQGLHGLDVEGPSGGPGRVSKRSAERNRPRRKGVRGQRRENGQCSPQARSGNAGQAEVNLYIVTLNAARLVGVPRFFWP